MGPESSFSAVHHATGPSGLQVPSVFQAPVPADVKDPIFAAFLVALPWIAKLVGAAVVTVGVAEIIRGPLQQALNGVIPHEEAAVRNLSTMYVTGTISRDEFLNSSSIKQLQEPDRSYIIRYADFMANKKAQDEAAKSQRSLAGDLESYIKTLNTDDSKEFDSSLDIIEAKLKAAESALAKLNEDELDESFKSDIALDEVIVGSYDSALRAIAAKDPNEAPAVQRIAKADFLSLAESVLLNFLTVEAEAGRMPGVLALEDEAMKQLLDEQLITQAQLDFAITQGYDVALRLRAGEILAEIFEPVEA